MVGDEDKKGLQGFDLDQENIKLKVNVNVGKPNYVLHVLDINKDLRHMRNSSRYEWL